MEALSEPIAACRACGCAELPVVLDLGDLAISAFLPPGESFDRAPLVVVQCPACGLAQLRDTVSRERLFRTYHYRSGTQEMMVAALRDVVADALRRVDLLPGDTVVDIGANDGTLLGMYPDTTERYAWEPAPAFWPSITRTGANVAGGFFPTRIAGEPITLPRKAKIVTSIACFYASPDPGAFVEGVKAILARDGIWINQMAYLPATLATNNFGDVVHEHLTYWTIDSFARLLDAHDMRLLGCSNNDVNGGSVRFVVGRGRAPLGGIDTPSMAAWAGFRERIILQAQQVRNAVSRAGNVWGYGASTKGNTYLQVWGLGEPAVPFIADRNREKHLLVTPTGQTILSEEYMRLCQPEALLILPWHFLPAFVERERAYLAAGGRFIVPFPEVRVLGKEVLDADLPASLAA